MTTTAPPPSDDALRDRLRALPKTELHIHLLGALRPATIAEWARRRGSPLLGAAERGAEEGLRFAHLSEFVSFFIGLFELVTGPAEFERAAAEVLEDLRALGVRYAEIRVTPTSHVARGATVEGMWDGLEAARREAERGGDIAARWVVDLPRGLPLSVSEAGCAAALATRGRGTVGVDLAGDERAVGASPAFAPIFERARRGGLGVLAHAGEGAGPESVRGALDLYAPARIGHGTRSAEDPALLDRLARGRVPLEVCPTSNVRLGVVRAIAEHPVRRFLEVGVPLVVSSDDPTLFGTNIVEEHLRLHREAAVPLATLGRLAAGSFGHALLPEGERRERFSGAQREALSWAEAIA